MRLLVTGGRLYGLIPIVRYLDPRPSAQALAALIERKTQERERAFAELDRILAEDIGDDDILIIIEGGAKGADELARSWARINSVPCYTYRADWDQYGKAAGSIRNQTMLDDGKPDRVLAFPGGTGTADMVRRAKKANLPITMVELER